MQRDVVPGSGSSQLAPIQGLFNWQNIRFTFSVVYEFALVSIFVKVSSNLIFFQIFKVAKIYFSTKKFIWFKI
jgi:hypothetical protein